MNNINDNQFKKLFGMLQEEDAQDAPDFDLMWKKAQEQQKPQSPYWNWTVRASMAAATIIGLVGLWIRFQDTPPSYTLDNVNLEISDINTWEPSSNVLLSYDDSYDYSYDPVTADYQSNAESAESILTWEAPSDALLSMPRLEMQTTNQNEFEQEDFNKIELN
ncbi:MAG: hypothetical protein GY810_10350 [Aureispira sp.]|nr:hypothetical protein [Aureispira sp.]